jgi:hypothetical protein
MSTVKKVIYEKGYGKPVMNREIKNHDNDPFFIEKLEKAKIAVSKIVFPENMKK